MVGPEFCIASTRGGQHGRALVLTQLQVHHDDLRKVLGRGEERRRGLQTGRSGDRLGYVRGPEPAVIPSGSAVAQGLRCCCVGVLQLQRPEDMFVEIVGKPLAGNGFDDHAERVVAGVGVFERRAGSVTELDSRQCAKPGLERGRTLIVAQRVEDLVVAEDGNPLE